MSDSVWSCLIMSDPVWSCLTFLLCSPADPVWSCLILSDLVWSCLILSDPVWSSLILSDLVWSCQILSDHVWSSLIQSDPVSPSSCLVLLILASQRIEDVIGWDYGEPGSSTKVERNQHWPSYPSSLSWKTKWLRPLYCLEGTIFWH